jgi:hypothetical protein
MQSQRQRPQQRLQHTRQLIQQQQQRQQQQLVVSK